MTEQNEILIFWHLGGTPPQAASGVRLSADSIAAAARDLVALATKHGLVLTVEQVPAGPPRMGGYDSQVSVRAARGRY